MKHEKILYALLIIGFITALLIIFYNTNIFFVHKGTVAHRNIYVSNSDEVRFLQLQRNEHTPSMKDQVVFSNGYDFTYLASGVNKVTVKITVPHDIDRGTYYVDYTVTRGDEVFTHIRGLKVRVR